MTPEAIIEAIRTTALVVLAIGFIYVVVRLERTLHAATASMNQLLHDQAVIGRRLDEITERLQALERWQSNEAKGRTA